jgi:glycosyltransferase involved in cell wall biosynthesis
MKIALVTEHYWPDIGGVERSTANLAAALAPGRQVEVLTVARPGRPAVDERDGIVVRRFGAVGASPWPGMRERIERWNPHAVCFFGFSDDWTEAQLDLIAHCGPRVPVTSFKVPSVREFTQYGAPAASIGRFLALHHVICLNQAIERELRHAGVPSARIRRVPNGVDCTAYRPPGTEERRRARAALGLDEAPTFLYTGRFAARKRVELLIEAFAQVPAARLILLGYLDDRYDGASVLPDPLPANVRVDAPTDDVRPYLRAADAFVSASVGEGMPNAVLEAMACGLPLLLSDIPGHRELVEPDVNGALVTPDEPAALVAALEALVAEPSALKAMGAHSRALARERFPMQRVEAAYLGLFHA